MDETQNTIKELETTFQLLLTKEKELKDLESKLQQMIQDFEIQKKDFFILVDKKEKDFIFKHTFYSDSSIMFKYKTKPVFVSQAKMILDFKPNDILNKDIIRKKYLELLKEYHPDTILHENNKFKTEVYDVISKNLNESYKILQGSYK